MATNPVEGVLRASNGMMIPLEAEIAEGTESSLTTNTTYTVTAQSAGDYGQGMTITHGMVFCDNGASYAYVLSQGLVAVTIPIGVKGVGSAMPALPKPYTLKPGDSVRVLNLTAAARNAALSVYTNTGECRIFVGTPSGSGSQALLDLQTSNTIGSTLQGQNIVSATFTSIDGAKVETPGAIIVSDANNVVGAVPMSNPAKTQPLDAPVFGAPIALNYTASFKLNA